MPSTPLHASAHEHHSRLILGAFEADHSVSQRSLAKDLGIALGLTNLLVKRLVVKGLVRVIQIKPNRVRYLITPAGIAEKTRMSRAYFDSSVQFYRQTRDRIQRSFPPSRQLGGRANAERPSHCVPPAVAEIGYICLIGAVLHLVSVVDAPGPTFFEAPFALLNARRAALNRRPAIGWSSCHSAAPASCGPTFSSGCSFVRVLVVNTPCQCQHNLRPWSGRRKSGGGRDRAGISHA